MAHSISLKPSIHAELATWRTAGDKQEAQKRIQQAYEQGSKILNLSFLGLDTLPDCICKLVDLEILMLDGNNLGHLPDKLANLTHLAMLCLDYNKRLQDLPRGLAKVPSLQTITTGGTDISDRVFSEVQGKKRAWALQDKAVAFKDRFKTDTLMFNFRPPEVQKKIDTIFEQLKRQGKNWLYQGKWGFYGLLNFDDRHVIAQRIERASPNKKGLWFIDFGADQFGWVDAVRSFLREHYGDDPHHFHIIGTTGEGESYDEVHEEGNITTHKITGFKLENLLEAFETFHLPLINSVEFITMSHTLQHLVDPIGTLEQARCLLTPGNGFLFGTGFHCFHGHTLGKTLSKAFGIHGYVARKEESQFHNFALFRSEEDLYPPSQSSFIYNKAHPLMDLNYASSDCYAACGADMFPRDASETSTYPMGGGFYGFGTYVLEQLIGQGPKKIRFEGKEFERPLFKETSGNACKLYLDSYGLLPNCVYEIECEKTQTQGYLSFLSQIKEKTN